MESGNSPNQADPIKYRRRDSNPHDCNQSRDFKSRASAIPPLRRGKSPTPPEIARFRVESEESVYYHLKYELYTSDRGVVRFNEFQMHCDICTSRLILFGRSNRSGFDWIRRRSKRRPPTIMVSC